MRVDELTPEARAAALYYFFGQMGGPIHEFEAKTGLSAPDLLTRGHGDAPLSGGFSAVRTCGTEWRRDHLAPQELGNWPFWRDVMVGFWITGPLCSEMASRMAGPVKIDRA